MVIAIQPYKQKEIRGWGERLPPLSPLFFRRTKRLGDEDVLDGGSADRVPDDVFRLTVSASGRHFYGRLDGEALGHGHASPEAAGGVGLFFDGSGKVRIHSVTVTPI